MIGHFNPVFGSALVNAGSGIIDPMVGRKQGERSQRDKLKLLEAEQQGNMDFLKQMQGGPPNPFAGGGVETAGGGMGNLPNPFGAELGQTLQMPGLASKFSLGGSEILAGLGGGAGAGAAGAAGAGGLLAQLGPLAMLCRAAEATFGVDHPMTNRARYAVNRTWPEWAKAIYRKNMYEAARLIKKHKPVKALAAAFFALVGFGKPEMKPDGSIQ